MSQTWQLPNGFDKIWQKSVMFLSRFACNIVASHEQHHLSLENIWVLFAAIDNRIYGPRLTNVTPLMEVKDCPNMEVIPIQNGISCR